ncbi:MAG: hypothetical protein ACOYN0_01375 [Phycisphaerales bacterium]
MNAPATTPPSDSTGTRRCCFFLALSLLCGCRVHVGGESTVEAENHRLRTESRALRDRVDTLTAERDEAKAQVRALDGSLPDSPMPGAIEATPRLARLTIADDSAIDLGGVAHLYIETRDGRGRTLQVVGTLSAQILNADGRVLAEHSLGPLALREAYREGPFGTHYLVEFNVKDATAADRVRVVLAEASGAAPAEAAAPLRVVGR